MADRTLVSYEETRLEYGPHWTLTASRSAAGAPGLFFTIKTSTGSPEDRHIVALNQEMTIYVEDGNEFLKPIIAWLEANPVTLTPETEKP